MLAWLTFAFALVGLGLAVALWLAVLVVIGKVKPYLELASAFQPTPASLVGDFTVDAPAEGVVDRITEWTGEA